ncbi:hypothetical protein CLCAR_3472 [Clostridium carboxidivorans P7]|nr:hypothetical protein CLCAR_3472 [Clostridium carboxidivorans P7]
MRFMLIQSITSIAAASAVHNAAKLVTSLFHYNFIDFFQK